jgi:hypothetical protein
MNKLSRLIDKADKELFSGHPIFIIFSGLLFIFLDLWGLLPLCKEPMEFILFGLSILIGIAIVFLGIIKGETKKKSKENK